jgi:hypothetical protein
MLGYNIDTTAALYLAPWASPAPEEFCRGSQGSREQLSVTVMKRSMSRTSSGLKSLSLRMTWPYATPPEVDG